MRMTSITTASNMNYTSNDTISLGFGIDQSATSWDNLLNNQNIHQWNCINNSFDIEMENKLDFDMIRNLVYNWRYRDPQFLPIIDSVRKKAFYSKSIIKSLGIRMNNSIREEQRPIEYYNHIEKFHLMNHADESEIAIYSFSLNNNSIQPIGSCDFAKLNNVIIDVELKDPTQYEKYKYDLDIYIKYYNEIEYINGKGAIKYSN